MWHEVSESALLTAMLHDFRVNVQLRSTDFDQPMSCCAKLPSARGDVTYWDKRTGQAPESGARNVSWNGASAWRGVPAYPQNVIAAAFSMDEWAYLEGFKKKAAACLLAL